jgi:hypothetical protein
MYLITARLCYVSRVGVRFAFTQLVHCETFTLASLMSAPKPYTAQTTKHGAFRMAMNFYEPSECVQQTSVNGLATDRSRHVVIWHRKIEISSVRQSMTAVRYALCLIA